MKQIKDENIRKKELISNLKSKIDNDAKSHETTC